ncbi:MULTISPECIES: hypothetical protein [Niastella]|uniref:Receptor L-domain domain-containing protein n=1 Tax=Niastella soli TaxID=2821487 RepID=A0ABS3Z1A1_9BACT|nr:hypothetical protein [Niastella soli]MBO9203940.1 hypothetical protein [Niastella soli]
MSTPDQKNSPAQDNLNNVKSLTEVGGVFVLSSLPLLRDISSLKTLKQVGDSFMVQYLDQLTDQTLASFSSLRSVGGDLSLISLPNLVSLNGLSLLTGVQRVFIYDNQQLTNYTGLKNVIPTLPGANWQVSNNKYDPTYQDMIAGKYVAP